MVGLEIYGCNQITLTLLYLFFAGFCPVWRQWSLVKRKTKCNTFVDYAIFGSTVVVLRFKQYNQLLKWIPSMPSFIPAQLCSVWARDENCNVDIPVAAHKYIWTFLVLLHLIADTIFFNNVVLPVPAWPVINTECPSKHKSMHSCPSSIINVAGKNDDYLCSE